MFSFKNLAAGEPLSPEILSECKILSNKTQDVAHCYYGPVDVSGATVYTSANFYKGKLSELEMEVPSYDAATVMRAFSAKYGTPCKSETLI